MVRAEVEEPATMAGGFVLVPVVELMHAWRACRSAPLGIAEFRAWLAAREMVARRCRPTRRTRPGQVTETTARGISSYDDPELAKLLDVTTKRARASVRRLEAAGLIRWSAESIIFPGPAGKDDGGVDSVPDTIGRGLDSLAVPRRVLRFLVAGAKGSVIAAAMATLLRCLSRRRAGWCGRGRLKASWIAKVFGISGRQAKAARAELVSLGWLAAEDSDQWAVIRWGKVYRIDLGWSGPISSPPSADTGPISSPPDLQTPIPSGRKYHQEPAGGPTGFPIEGPVEKAAPRDPEPAPTPAPTAARTTIPPETTRSSTGPDPTVPAPTGVSPEGTTLRGTPQEGSGSAKPLPAPTLADVRVADLKDTGRLLQLHDQAAGKGLVTTAEADRLRVVAAAEHALAIGRENPAGLFAHLVRGRRWRYLTGADEDRANARIKAHLRGPEPFSGVPVGKTCPSGTFSARAPANQWPQGSNTVPGRNRNGTSVGDEPGKSRVMGTELSEDARIVREIRAACIRARIYRDPWPAFSAKYPGWDRARWDRAMGELGLA